MYSRALGASVEMCARAGRRRSPSEQDRGFQQLARFVLQQDITTGGQEPVWPGGIRRIHQTRVLGHDYLSLVDLTCALPANLGHACRRKRSVIPHPGDRRLRCGGPQAVARIQPTPLCAGHAIRFVQVSTRRRHTRSRALHRRPRSRAAAWFRRRGFPPNRRRAPAAMSRTSPGVQ